jgi:simple sugar transport system ATP-binding protein
MWAKEAGSWLVPCPEENARCWRSAGRCISGRLLILDEPTSSLGFKQAAIVLRLIQKAKAEGTAVVFITHSAHHAITVGDRFSVLIQGSVAAQFSRGEKTR